MTDNTNQEAAAELAELTTPAATPKSAQEVINALLGFGIEDNEEIITAVSGNRTLRLRIQNLPTEADMAALLAAEEFKGPAWMQRVKCELLSRAVSWLDGISIRSLIPEQRFVVDPTDAQHPKRDIQVVLRNLMLGWGQETIGVLWKALMVHSQKIEDRLVEQFPEAALITDTEKRWLEMAEEIAGDQVEQMIRRSVDTDDVEPTAEKQQSAVPNEES